MRADEVKMVDVSAKAPARRKAVARGVIFCNRAPSRPIEKDEVAKGNVFACARRGGHSCRQKKQVS